MRLTLNRELYLQILFMIAVIVPFFNNYELSFIVWFFIAVISVKSKYDIRFLKYLSYFIIIFLLSLFIGFFFKYNLFYTIRDITYLLKPVFGLIIGYQLFSSKIKNPFLFIVYAGVAGASYHLILVVYGILFEGARAVSEIRDIAGFFNDFEVYTLIILIFHKQFQLNLDKKKTGIFLIILAFSSFFYLARTNFIQFIILFFALKGWLVINKKAITIILSLITVSVLSYVAIYNYNPRRNGNGLDEFLYKLKVLPEEALSTKINRNDWKDFHDHYRSYEIVRTIEQLKHNKTYLFGEGIGSQVDLKQKVYLGDMELRHISILHNGYMTVFLKSGILGTFFLLVSILFFFSKFKAVNNLDTNINIVFKGTGFFLIISYWVFLGFYNLLDTKTLLIGFLFAYKFNLTKLNENNINHTPIS
jgi:hypothetical protein